MRIELKMMKKMKKKGKMLYDYTDSKKLLAYKVSENYLFFFK